MPNDRTKVIPLADLRTEPGSDELVRSESMKPYLEVLKAEMGGRDTGPALAELAALPLEQRYVWRVISALKWGLCDLDTESVAADVATLSEQELKSVAEPLALRAMQFSLFLKALVGKTDAKRDYAAGALLPKWLKSPMIPSRRPLKFHSSSVTRLRPLAKSDSY